MDEGSRLRGHEGYGVCSFGAPAKRQFRGERRQNGMNETCRSRQGEGYEVSADDMGLHWFRRGQ